MTRLLAVAFIAFFIVLKMCHPASGYSSCQQLKTNHTETVSGVYDITPLPHHTPLRVYCEMAIDGGGYTFLPRSLTARTDAQQIVNALFNDRKNVLLKLQKKPDRSEWYTLIQPLARFAELNFGVLVNSYSGYTAPLNSAIMNDYIFLGILPRSTAANRNVQGFRSNGVDVQFNNCDAVPNSLFAFFPNHNLQTPNSYLASNLFFERQGMAVDWRRQARPITHPDRMMPNDFFFLTELYFGGCGCYSSSDRWSKFGFHATAIGVR